MKASGEKKEYAGWALGVAALPYAKTKYFEFF